MQAFKLTVCTNLALIQANTSEAPGNQYLPVVNVLLVPDDLDTDRNFKDQVGEENIEKFSHRVDYEKSE
jgi:hypothetical protein